MKRRGARRTDGLEECVVGRERIEVHVHVLLHGHVLQAMRHCLFGHRSIDDTHKLARRNVYIRTRASQASVSDRAASPGLLVCLFTLAWG
jgi:hypothetical protein